MTIKIAKTSGFCYGVRRAMELGLKSATSDQSKIVYTWGPLVHNTQAVDLLRDRKIEPAKSIDTVKNRPVLIRAHGVSREVRHKLDEYAEEVIDATCPHVRRTQRLASENSREGYDVIIIGDRGHPEVTGLMGYVEGSRSFVVENPEEVSSLPDSLQKVCVVAQTTQSEDRFELITQKIKERYSDVRAFNTVCGATVQRQKEIKEIADEVDIVIVIGGYHSANTKRLAEIAKSRGAPTIHIETANELSFDQVAQYSTIGVAAGASTPHWVIRNVIERLRDFEERKRPGLCRTLRHLIRFVIYSQLYLAIGAAGLTYTVQLLLGLKPTLIPCLLAGLYVLSMHIINRYLRIPEDESLVYGIQKYFSRHKILMRDIWIISGIATIVVSITYGWLSLALVIVSLLLGALYSMAIVPVKWLPQLRYRRLMDIPGSKNFFMSIAWAMVTVIIPFVANRAEPPLPSFILSIVMVFALVLLRSLICDLRDIEGDIILGRETIPLILGVEKTHRVIGALLGILIVLLLVGGLLPVFPLFSLLLLIPIGYIMVTSYHRWQTEFYQSLAYDALVDGQFILIALIGIVWNTIIH